PPADFVASPLFGVDSGVGKVALVNTTNPQGTNCSGPEIEDFVGYGLLAGCQEGVAPTPNLNNIHVAVRKNNGCQDQNQNAIDSDLVLALAMPHNGASTPFICPAPPCPADFDGNGQIQPADIAAAVSVWFASVQAGTLAGDFDQNGTVQPADIAFFVNL